MVVAATEPSACVNITLALLLTLHVNAMSSSVSEGRVPLDAGKRMLGVTISVFASPFSLTTRTAPPVSMTGVTSPCRYSGVRVGVGENVGVNVVVVDTVSVAVALVVLDTDTDVDTESDGDAVAEVDVDTEVDADTESVSVAVAEVDTEAVSVVVTVDDLL